MHQRWCILLSDGHGDVNADNMGIKIEEIEKSKLTADKLKIAHDFFLSYCEKNNIKKGTKKHREASHLFLLTLSIGQEMYEDKMHPRIWIAALRCDVGELV